MQCRVILLLLCVSCGSSRAEVARQNGPPIPRIDSVEMLDPQPHERDPRVIWYDNFDSQQRQQEYAEASGNLTEQQAFGGRGTSLPMHYAKGSRGTGGRKVFFGDSPTYLAKTVRRDETFSEVYWRIYVKHEQGWQGGGPAKLSRATSLVPPGWRQAMIAHVWSSGDALTLDPATGVKGDQVVTTRYNDFENLRWLGNNPASRFQLHSTEESGRWVCVEARVRLNTPGQKDGLNQLWIDGRLEAERTDLDWRGKFQDRGVNAVFLEAYWNQGSPVDQSRWIDNFVISTVPIGPVTSSRTPVLIKTPYQGTGGLESWEVELSESGESLVWKSKPVRDGEKLRVDSNTGQFVGKRSGENNLDSGRLYFVRVRQRNTEGHWSPWSAWHQPFQTP